MGQTQSSELGAYALPSGTLLASTAEMTPPSSLGAGTGTGTESSKAKKRRHKKKHRDRRETNPEENMSTEAKESMIAHDDSIDGRGGVAGGGENEEEDEWVPNEVEAFSSLAVAAFPHSVDPVNESYAKDRPAHERTFPSAITTSYIQSPSDATFRKHLSVKELKKRRRRERKANGKSANHSFWHTTDGDGLIPEADLPMQPAPATTRHLPTVRLDSRMEPAPAIIPGTPSQGHKKRKRSEEARERKKQRLESGGDSTDGTQIKAGRQESLEAVAETQEGPVQVEEDKIDVTPGQIKDSLPDPVSATNAVRSSWIGWFGSARTGDDGLDAESPSSDDGDTGGAPAINDAEQEWNRGSDQSGGIVMQEHVLAIDSDENASIDAANQLHNIEPDQVRNGSGPDGNGERLEATPDQEQDSSDSDDSSDAASEDHDGLENKNEKRPAGDDVANDREDLVPAISDDDGERSGAAANMDDSPMFQRYQPLKPGSTSTPSIATAAVDKGQKNNPKQGSAQSKKRDHPNKSTATASGDSIAEDYGARISTETKKRGRPKEPTDPANVDGISQDHTPPESAQPKKRGRSNKSTAPARQEERAIEARFASNLTAAISNSRESSTRPPVTARESESANKSEEAVDGLRNNREQTADSEHGAEVAQNPVAKREGISTSKKSKMGRPKTNPPKPEYIPGRLADTELRKIDTVIREFQRQTGYPDEDVPHEIRKDLDRHPKLWAALNQVLFSRDPKKIVKETRKRFPVKTIGGNFEDEEHEALHAAVRAFRNDHGATQTDVSRLIQENSKIRDPSNQKSDLWRRLYDACPDRAAWKVRQVARRMWPVLRVELDADEVGTKGGQWTEKEEVKLTQGVIDYIRKLDQTRGDSNGATVHSDNRPLRWQDIKEALGGAKTVEQCKMKWRYMGLQVKGDDVLLSQLPGAVISWELQKARLKVRAMTPTDKRELIQAIRNSSAGSDSAIPWQKLASAEYRTTWGRSCLRLAWNRLKAVVPVESKRTVRHCSDYLLRNFEFGQDYGEPGDADVADEDEERYLQYFASDLAKKRGPRRGSQLASKRARLNLNKMPTSISKETVSESDSSDDEGRTDGTGSPAHTACSRKLSNASKRARGSSMTPESRKQEASIEPPESSSESEEDGLAPGMSDSVDGEERKGAEDEDEQDSRDLELVSRDEDAETAPAEGVFNSINQSLRRSVQRATSFLSAGPNKSTTKPYTHRKTKHHDPEATQAAGSMAESEIDAAAADVENSEDNDVAQVNKSPSVTRRNRLMASTAKTSSRKKKKKQKHAEKKSGQIDWLVDETASKEVNRAPTGGDSDSDMMDMEDILSRVPAREGMVSP
jgi:hypothetical protein